MICLLYSGTKLKTQVSNFRSPAAGLILPFAETGFNLFQDYIRTGMFWERNWTILLINNNPKVRVRFVTIHLFV